MVIRSVSARLLDPSTRWPGARQRGSRPLAAAAGVVLITFAVAGCGSVGGLTGFPPTSSVSENTPPSVLSVLPPADGSAPADTPISASFNKPMSTGGLEISAEPAVTFSPAQWSDDNKTVTVRPESPLVPGGRYTIRLRARDRQGNSLARDQVWSFTATAPTGVTGAGQLRLAERIDVAADARVFTLFAALLAASSDASAGEPGSVRAAVRTKMRELPARVTDPVRRFLTDNPASVEQYLAAALRLSAPPEFRETSGETRPPQAAATPQAPQPVPTAQAPQPVPTAQPPQPTPTAQPSPPVQPTPGAAATPPPSGTSTTGAPAASGEVADLGRVLAQFYTEAGIADLWKAHERAHAGAVDAHRKDAPALLGRAADYLRTTAIPSGRIMVLPNLVDTPGQGYLIRQGERVYLIVGSRGSVDRIGLLRPFARLVLDPIRGQAPEQLQRTDPLYVQVRELAGRNGYRSWSDVVVASLIEATTIRLALAADAVAASQRAAYARGLVLVDHFAAQLIEYERTTISLVDYYPRMIAATDLELELRRWAERKPN